MQDHTTKRYLTALRDDKRVLAATLRSVADSVKTNHKKVTARTVEHADTNIRRGGYRPELAVYYEQVNAEFYRGRQVMTFWLTEGHDDTPVTPEALKAAVLEAAKYVDINADQLTAEIETIETKAADLRRAIADYNAIVDGLTPYARDVFGTQHIYNHKLGA